MIDNQKPKKSYLRGKMRFSIKPFQILKTSKTVRNGSLFAIFSFFNRGISFVLLTILARYLSPTDYGELSLFNTFVMFLSYFVGLSTAGYLNVSYFQEKRDTFRKDFSAICIITVVVSLILLFLIGLNSKSLATWLKIPVQFIFWGLLISFCNVFIGINLDYYRIQEKLPKYGILSCSFAILNFVLALYLVVIKKLNWQGQVYSLVICNGIFAIIALIIFFKSKLLTFPRHITNYRKIILWGLPIIPHQASGWMKQGLDRIIIDRTHSIADVGLFSFALTLASIVIMIGTAFNQTNSVNLYQTLSSHETKENKLRGLRHKEKYFTLLYCAVTVLIVTGGYFLIPLFMPKYTPCIPYFIILSIYGLGQCVYFLYCNYLFYFKATKNLMMISVASAILHLILSLWLTKYSLYYTCFIYIITVAIVVMSVYFQSRRLIKEKLK